MKRVDLALAACALSCRSLGQTPPATDWNVFFTPMVGTMERAGEAFQRDGNGYVLRSRLGPGNDRTLALLKVGPEGRIEWETAVGSSGSSVVDSFGLQANAQGEPTVATVSRLKFNGAPVARCGLERLDRWGSRRWAVSSDSEHVVRFDAIRWPGSTPGALVLWQDNDDSQMTCRRMGPNGQVLAESDLDALFNDHAEVDSALESPAGDVYVTGRTSALRTFVRMLAPSLGSVVWSRDFGSDTIVNACACKDGGLALTTYGAAGRGSHDLTKYDRTGAVLWTVNYYRDFNHLLDPQSLAEGPNGRLYVRAFYDWGGVLNESTGHVYVFEPNGEWAWFGEFFLGIRSSVSAVTPGPAECAAVAYGGNDGNGTSSTAIEFVSGNAEHVWLKPFAKGTYGFDNLYPGVAVDPVDAVLVSGTAVKAGEPDRLWIAKYLLAGTGTLYPTAVKASIGKLEQGTTSDLRVRDEKPVRLWPIGTGVGAFRAQAVVDGIQSLFERTPVSVNVASRLSSSDRASLTIEQWSWIQSRWVTVKDAADVTAQAESAVWPLPGPYARFVGSGGKMRTRLTYALRPPSGSSLPRVLIDKCTWTALAP